MTDFLRSRFTVGLLGVLLSGCGQGSHPAAPGSGGSDEGGAGSGGKPSGGSSGTGGSGGDDSTGGAGGSGGPIACSSADAGAPTGDVTAPGTASRARPFLKPRPKDTAAQPWV